MINKEYPKQSTPLPHKKGTPPVKIVPKIANKATYPIVGDRGACVICGFDRVVDRCHIIPRRVIGGIIGFEKLASFAPSRNLITLCKNHHVLFDSQKLTDEEWQMIRPYIAGIKKDLLRIANSNLKPIGKTAYTHTKSKESKIKLWLYQIYQKYGLTRQKTSR